ncbi:MAG TPA: hypothetical protein DEB25_00085 [Desulfobulbaceae bacterium]|nr:hypothetical protein [Desulfobulbaceae bacterium]
MELHVIPYQDKFIIYRPLRRLAFIANRAMARLCERLAAGDAPSVADDEALRFLQEVGFFAEEEKITSGLAASVVFQPTICVLMLTNTCNLRCVYCYAHGGDEGATRQLPLALATTAIDRVCREAVARKQDHFRLAFHGNGEPTTAWRLLTDCVAHARRAKLPARINLTTNGMWTEKQCSWILDNIDRVSLSFDGPPAVQNRQRPTRRGDASHSLVARNIKALDRRGMDYGIRVTITDNSIVSLPEIIGYICQETGVGTIQVEPAFGAGRAKTDQTALARHMAFAEAFMAGYDIARKYRRHMYYSGARPWLLTDRFCDAFASALVVTPDGFITSCYEICDRQHELARDFIFGDIRTDGGMRVDKKIRQAFVARIEERQQGCRRCFCFHHCAGDCPAKTFSVHPRGHLRQGARCELNRTLTRELIVRYILAGNGVWDGQAQATPM